MNKFVGNYRGIVVSNTDPNVKGRLKIYVPGVYPEDLAKNSSNLPWAEPMMPLFGGNWTNERSGDLNSETGVTTIPHTSNTPLNGAQVWVFFEQGNCQYPVYIGACQGGEGWGSEHNNQHVIKTDNVRVRIDENPESDSSTCKFDSYNENCTHLSQKKSKEQTPTRIDIEVWNEGNSAINLIVKGDVNIKVEGDVFEEITGDKHETLIGNLYRKHTGDIHYIHEGVEVYEHDGKYTEKTTGDKTINHDGNKRELITQDDRKEVLNSQLNIVGGQRIDETFAGVLDMVTGQRTEATIGDKITTVIGPNTNFLATNYTFVTNDIINASIDGNIYNQTIKDGGSIIDKAMNLKRVAKTSVIDSVDSTAGGDINHNDTVFVNAPEYPV